MVIKKLNQNNWCNKLAIMCKGLQTSKKRSKLLKYSGHPLSRTSTGPAKKFVITNVRDSGKFKILAFYQVLGKPNTVFTSVLTLVSFKGNR